MVDMSLCLIFYDLIIKYTRQGLAGFKGLSKLRAPLEIKKPISKEAQF